MNRELAIKITKNKHQIAYKLQMTSTKYQINYNIQKINACTENGRSNQNCFGH